MYKLFLHNFLNLFFPVRCVACHGVCIYGEACICTHCLAMLPYAYKRSSNDLVKKFYGLAPIWEANAFFSFSKHSYVQRLLHVLKYENKPRLAELLGKYYGAVLQQKSYISHYDAILPVPLHVSRLRRRGYNQSAFFAKGLSHTLGLPWYQDWLVKKVATEAQSTKSSIERWHNVADAFSLSGKECVDGKRILLVDDVVTTGATLVACSNVLFKAGAEAVSVATLALVE